MINIDPGVKTISVSPDPFYVSIERGEEVVWAIKPDNYCFTVHFAGGPNGSPFEGTTFGHNHSHSGLPRRDAQLHPHLYKYTVTVPGIGALDPNGGVTP
jgi:hypothetical protein